MDVSALDSAATVSHCSGERMDRGGEEELVRRLRAGDEGAFEELHRRHRRRIYAFALKRLEDHAEAEDVTQDVFLQIFRCIESFEGRSSLLTWMFGIAHHETCNRFRRRALPTVPLEEEARQVPSRSAPVDRAVDAARVLDRCAAALADHVTESQRKVFQLRYRENLPVSRIARNLRKTSGAVKIGLMRSRRALEQSTCGLQQLLA